MLGLPLVELVKLGFLGFAVALMLMAFYSLRKVTILSATIPAAKLAVMSRTVIFFLGGSLLAIGLGIVYAVLSPEVNVVFDVNPRSIGANELEVRVAGRKLDLPEEFEAAIRDRNEVTIDLSGIANRVGDLERDVESLKALMKLATEKIDAQNSQRDAEVRANIEAGSSNLVIDQQSGY